MKNLPEYITEQDSKGQPLTFDIYNTGQKNRGFEITIKSLWHKMGNFKQHLLLCPLSPNSLRYKGGTDVETTENFTKMPEVVKYVEADSWHGWDNTLKNYLYYELKPFIKHGKISVTLQAYKDDEKYIEMVVNEQDFVSEREAKIKQMEDPTNLDTWKANWEEKEKARKDKEEAEAQAKKEYEEWKSNLSAEDKQSRSMGYGPHHPYEETHPWDSPGFKTSRGWYTGD